MNFFAPNIKYLRKLKKENQSKVASDMGFAANRWSNYETGSSKPSFDDLMKIIEYFDIDAHSLLYTDLEKVHLLSNSDSHNLQGNLHLNTHPSVHLNRDLKSDLTSVSMSEPRVNYGNDREMELNILRKAVESLSASNAHLLRHIEVLEHQNELLRKHIPAIGDEDALSSSLSA